MPEALNGRLTLKAARPKMDAMMCYGDFNTESYCIDALGVMRLPATLGHGCLRFDKATYE